MNGQLERVVILPGSLDELPRYLRMIDSPDLAEVVKCPEQHQPQRGSSEGTQTSHLVAQALENEVGCRIEQLRINRDRRTPGTWKRSPDPCLQAVLVADLVRNPALDVGYKLTA